MGSKLPYNQTYVGLDQRIRPKKFWRVPQVRKFRSRRKSNHFNRKITVNSEEKERRILGTLGNSKVIYLIC